MDEEKIVWAYTRGFPQRIIQAAFPFGSDKVSRTINHFKQTGTTPSPAKSNPRIKNYTKCFPLHPKSIGI